MGENKIKAAVIDDDRYTVQAIKKCLEKLELLDQIDSFTDPTLALESIEATQHELIITDNTMPIIDGIELAERVLEIYKPVLILVSVICDKVKTNFDGEELFDYIFQKPLDYEQFVKEIAEIIKIIENEKMLRKIDVKNRLFIEEAISILKEDYKAEVLTTLSEEMHRDRSTIRKRLNRIGKKFGKEIVEKFLKNAKGEEEDEQQNTNNK